MFAKFSVKHRYVSDHSHAPGAQTNWTLIAPSISGEGGVKGGVYKILLESLDATKKTCVQVAYDGKIVDPALLEAGESLVLVARGPVLYRLETGDPAAEAVLHVWQHPYPESWRTDLSVDGPDTL